ncbi:hypothetical protein Bca4012_065539 [Brassica carinata]
MRTTKAGFDRSQQSGSISSKLLLDQSLEIISQQLCDRRGISFRELARFVMGRCICSQNGLTYSLTPHGNQSYKLAQQKGRCSFFDPRNPKHEVVVKLHKFYKKFRTKCKLAGCAELVEQSRGVYSLENNRYGW